MMSEPLQITAIVSCSLIVGGTVLKWMDSKLNGKYLKDSAEHLARIDATLTGIAVSTRLTSKGVDDVKDDLRGFNQEVSRCRTRCIATATRVKSGAG